MRERTFGDPEIRTAAVDQKQKWSFRGFVPISENRLGDVLPPATSVARTPAQRFLEPVVTPEDLLPNDEGGRMGRY
jgi:hypothetical protein